MRWWATLAIWIMLCHCPPCSAQNDAATGSSDQKQSAVKQDSAARGNSNSSPAQTAAAPAGSNAKHNVPTGTGSAGSSPKFSGIELAPTLAPVPEPPKPLFDGKPTRLTAGVEDKELLIEWDDWRNQFANAVERNIFHSPVEALIVPMGVTAYVACTVTSDGHIKEARIIKSSGLIFYDSAVHKAIESLDGSKVPPFPAGSQRTEVTCKIGFTHVDKKTTRYVYFGDVEHQSMSGPDP